MLYDGVMHQADTTGGSTATITPPSPSAGLPCTLCGVRPNNDVLAICDTCLDAINAQPEWAQNRGGED
jgi:hypothetical protein